MNHIIRKIVDKIKRTDQYVIGSIILAPFAIWMFGSSFYLGYLEKESGKNGLMMKATVVDYYRMRNIGRYIRYEFEIEDEIHTGSNEMSQYTLNKGDTISIFYMKSELWDYFWVSVPVYQYYFDICPNPDSAAKYIVEFKK